MTRKVKLPSGREVEIKPLGVLGLRAIAKINPGMLSGEVSESTAENLDTSIAMVEACSVEPRFSETPTNGEINIDDLQLADFTALVAELGAFNKEAVEAITSPLAEMAAD